MHPKRKCHLGWIVTGCLYLRLRISLWWETARGVIDAIIVIIITNGRWDRVLPSATGRGVVHLQTQTTFSLQVLVDQKLYI